MTPAPTSTPHAKGGMAGEGKRSGGNCNAGTSGREGAQDIDNRVTRCRVGCCVGERRGSTVPRTGDGCAGCAVWGAAASLRHLLGTAAAGSGGAGGGGGGGTLHVLRQQPLLALDLLVVHSLAVLERAKAVAFDAAEVYEDILAFRTDDEPETLLRIEPLDVAGRHSVLPHKKATAARAAQTCRTRRAMNGGSARNAH